MRIVARLAETVHAWGPFVALCESAANHAMPGQDRIEFRVKRINLGADGAWNTEGHHTDCEAGNPAYRHGAHHTSRLDLSQQ